jgi:hypothetical protein
VTLWKTTIVRNGHVGAQRANCRPPSPQRAVGSWLPAQMTVYRPHRGASAGGTAEAAQIPCPFRLLRIPAVEQASSTKDTVRRRPPFGMVPTAFFNHVRSGSLRRCRTGSVLRCCNQIGTVIDLCTLAHMHSVARRRGLRYKPRDACPARSATEGAEPRSAASAEGRPRLRTRSWTVPGEVSAVKHCHCPSRRGAVHRSPPIEGTGRVRVVLIASTVDGS